MINAYKIGKTAVSAAALAGFAALFTAQAFAGECPADKYGVDVRTSGETTAVDVTDEELSSIDLATQIEGLDARRLRFRKLVVQPGGVVPWHDHTGRPALIYIDEGEITEYRSDCSVGVVLRAGDISTEVAGLKHWWMNEGDVPTVIFAADVKHD